MEITGADYDENGDAWVGNTKYRRMKKSDADYIYSDPTNWQAEYYFSWNGDDDDHYFKWKVLSNDGSTLAQSRAIVGRNVVNEDHPDYGTEGGNNTMDKVYLLCIGETSNPAYGICC